MSFKKTCSDLLNPDDLTKHFLCCTPINTLNLMFVGQGNNYSIDLDAQKNILDKTVNSELVKKYPIKHSYQKAFLKWLISKIEKESEEIHDDLYTAYCNLVSLTVDESAHYRHFLIENGSLNYITLKENTNIISGGTTGLCSWQGAVGLNDWCVRNKNELCEKVVLELGCGVGLTGLNVISTCSPKHYIFSDCHQTVLDRVSKNVKLNLLHDGETAELESQSKRLNLQFKYNTILVSVMELKWEDIGEYISEGWVIPDIIIGADILYEKNSFHSLVTGLKAFFNFDGRYAIIAATVRNAETISCFLDELGIHNLTFEECAPPEQTLCIQLTDSPVRILKIFQKR